MHLRESILLIILVLFLLDGDDGLACSVLIGFLRGQSLQLIVKLNLDVIEFQLLFALLVKDLVVERVGNGEVNG